MVGLACRRFAFEMIVKLRVQNPFGERLLQLVEKPVFGKNILRFRRKEARPVCPS